MRGKDEEIPKALDFSVRCDDFSITYYDLKGPGKHVKEYSSLLTVLENGKEVLKKKIEVNHPLYYKGVAFYQSSYGALHGVTLGVQGKGKKEKTLLRMSEGETAPIPGSPVMIRVLNYSHEVHNFGEGVQVVLFKPNQEPRPFWLLKNSPQLDQQRGDDFVLTFEGGDRKRIYGTSGGKGSRRVGGLDWKRVHDLRSHCLFLLFPSKGLGQNSKEFWERGHDGRFHQQKPGRF